MKKTFAAIGATALGCAVVGSGAVAPASAADTTTPCTDANAQVAATGNLTDNWYQDCVPQYGLGKAEFSIVADEDDPTVEFPADFVPLDELPDSAVTVTTPTDVAALGTYFAATPDVFIAPILPADSDLTDPTTQLYLAAVFAPVTSIAAVADADVPTGVAAECDPDGTLFATQWRATFAPVETTFSQSIDGEPWNYTIKATPLPTYFFGTFTDGLDDWCLSDGIHTLSAAEVGASSGEQFFALVFHSLPDIAVDESLAIFDLGTFGRDVDEPVVPVVPPVVPQQLAATGVDATPLAIAGGAFAAFGVLMLWLTRLAQRRRRA